MKEIGSYTQFLVDDLSQVALSYVVISGLAFQGVWAGLGKGSANFLVPLEALKCCSTSLLLLKRFKRSSKTINKKGS